jgi:DNA-3-methyladenine glycosylase
MNRRKPDSPPRVPTSAEFAPDHFSTADIRRLLPPLPRSFYLRPTLAVARDLPGTYLVRRSGTSLLIARIVEVEAYLGSRDPASHAFRGRTARNDVMFWKGGHLYVYFTYGMHFCCNVVTGREGIGMAILIRAGEPIAGVRQMARRRGTSDPTLLCSGPARLCQATGIGRKENGTDLCGKEIWIAGDPEIDASTARTRRARLGRSTRIGIREGKEHRWRFHIKGNPHVSKGRPSGPDGRRDHPSGPVERGGPPSGPDRRRGRPTR